MWRFQTALTMVIAGLLAVAVGCVRPPPPMDSPEAYWARKMLWGPDHDVVIGGDSRANRALAPSVMTNHLGNLRIVNFSFSSAGLTGEYLDGLANLLDPDGEKVLVLGVSPMTLAPRSAAESKYLEMKSKHAAEIFQQANLESFLEFFRPIDWEIAEPQLHVRTGEKVRIYHPNGWLAVIEDPPAPDLTIPFFEEYFVGNQVSAETVDELMARVREWRSEGITVFALRPPTTAKMVQLESRLSGFDEEDFAKRFRDAGGIWMEIPVDKYLCYDGSHLHARAARQLSVYVARRIADVLADKK